jgi:hypothetical protein
MSSTFGVAFCSHEWVDISDVLEAGDQQDEALHVYAETGVLYSAVPADVQIPL